MYETPTDTMYMVYLHLQYIYNYGCIIMHIYEEYIYGVLRSDTYIARPARPASSSGGRGWRRSAGR